MHFPIYSLLLSTVITGLCEARHSSAAHSHARRSFLIKDFQQRDLSSALGGLGSGLGGALDGVVNGLGLGTCLQDTFPPSTVF